jgi:hypothetical protein
MAAKENMSNNDPERPGTEVPASAAEILPNVTEETVTMNKTALCREAVTVGLLGGI